MYTIKEIIDHTLRNLICGYNSNIPICCVLWYSLCWNPLIMIFCIYFNSIYMRKPPRNFIEKFIISYSKRTDKIHFGYNPCFLHLLTDTETKVKDCFPCPNSEGGSYICKSRFGKADKPFGSFIH